MQFDAVVDVVVVKEEGVGKYSILLCDIEGHNKWVLPCGEVLNILDEHEFELADDSEIFDISCFHHLEQFTGLTMDMIDDGEMKNYKHYRIKRMGEMERDIIIFGYWCMTDDDKAAEIEKVLKKKKGNVAFFPYYENGKVILPEIADDTQVRVIQEVMSHFYKRDN